jgi:hypothetical protein
MTRNTDMFLRGKPFNLLVKFVLADSLRGWLRPVSNFTAKGYNSNR